MPEKTKPDKNPRLRPEHPQNDTPPHPSTAKTAQEAQAMALVYQAYLVECKIIANEETADSLFQIADVCESVDPGTVSELFDGVRAPLMALCDTLAHSLREDNRELKQSLEVLRQQRQAQASGIVRPNAIVVPGKPGQA